MLTYVSEAWLLPLLSCWSSEHAHMIMGVLLLLMQPILHTINDCGSCCLERSSIRVLTSSASFVLDS